MKLCTYTAQGQTRTGIVVGDSVIDTGVAGTMIDLIKDWDALKPQLEARAAAGDGVPLSSVKLEAPVQRPGKIFAIGLNYADHIAESKMGTPEQQVWFTKAQTSVNAPYDPILIARGAFTNDYEAELVAVIGTGGKHIAAADAPAAVFGYCIGNDVTERLAQHATPQWSFGKSFDTHAPMGPWIVTADELGDPHTMGIRCFVNGEKRQDSNTGHLVFNVWQQVEHLSKGMTLEPGDCLFTGTPGGIGAAMDPRQFLKAGDVVRTEIDKLGHIEGVMVAESSAVRILIIGATGNSGLALTRMALAQGHVVTAYVRSTEKLTALLGAQSDAPGLTVRTGTLDDHAALASAMAGQDAVINAAGNATTDPDFVPKVHAVIAAVELALGPGGRLWLFGGAAALDVPGFRVKAADLPLIPKVYKQHVHNLARVAETALDWSMLCPGPMVSSPSGQPTEGLRISGDCWPVEGPAPGGLFKTIRILKTFKQRMPEMIVTYEDAAQVILDNLEPNGPYSRRRVGLALPVGVTGSKPQAF